MKISLLVIQTKAILPAKNKEETAPADKIELYNKLVATLPAVERKGAAIPYTSLNGNMFSFLDKEGKMGLRLAEQEREKFMVQYKTKLFAAHGIIMKEYVTVPDTLLKDTMKMKKYFEMSYEYAKTLKAKPATRTRTTKKK